MCWPDGQSSYGTAAGDGESCDDDDSLVRYRCRYEFTLVQAYLRTFDRHYLPRLKHPLSNRVKRFPHANIEELEWPPDRNRHSTLSIIKTSSYH